MIDEALDIARRGGRYHRSRIGDFVRADIRTYVIDRLAASGGAAQGGGVIEIADGDGGGARLFGRAHMHVTMHEGVNVRALQGEFADHGFAGFP